MVRMPRLWSFTTALMLLCLLHALPAAAILKKGDPAPSLKVTTSAGQQVTLEKYRGRVLIIDFFATWCSPCREIIPYLIDLNRKYGKRGLEILGMNVDEDDKNLKEFMAARKINYPVANANEALQTEYGLRSVPTIFVINKKGVVAERYQGFSDSTRKSIETAVQKLLAE